MVIYKITCKINGKIYIGQTIGTMSSRWNDHVYNSKAGTGFFYRSIQKYGPANFTIEQITTAETIEELNNLEEKFIKELDCLYPKGFNLLPGGNNRRHHIETKNKIAKSLQGRPIKNRMNGAPKGRPVSKARKLQISKTMTGVPQPWKYKPVICNETGQVYKSIQEAASLTGIERTALLYLLKSGGRSRKTRLSFKYYMGVK